MFNMHEDNENKVDLESILSKISSLEYRVKNLEEELGIKPSSSSIYMDRLEANEVDSHIEIEDSDHGFESKIGGFGLALLGSIVLLFGIIFLAQYIQNSGSPLYSCFFGYVSVIGFFLLSGYLKNRVTHLSEMFNITGKLLLYYVTMRLHYFTDNPLISYDIPVIILLVFIIGFLLFRSHVKKSELYAGIALFFALGTGGLSNNTHIMLSLSVLVSVASVYFFFKYAWKRVLLLSLFLVYLSFLIWFLNNPLTRSASGVIAFHQYCHLYLFGCAAIFSLITLVPQKENFSKSVLLGSVILNGIFFSLLLLLFIPTFFTNNYTLIFIIISIYCMIFSIILKSYSSWKFAPSYYAMYGFVAISISVYAILNLPYTFLLLTIQSIYVVAIALWFRSKIIISMNAILFFALIITYLLASKSVDSINFTIAAVAFASARIINLKQKQLEIKTTLIRNFYLIVTFFFVLFSLYKSVADHYVTLSWTIVAIVYFVFSIVLHNVKYRWMAISTMLASALYLFIVDLSRISIVYRIIAFLFLAVISITLSLYYTKSKKNEINTDNTDNHEKNDSIDNS